MEKIDNWIEREGEHYYSNSPPRHEALVKMSRGAFGKTVFGLRVGLSSGLWWVVSSVAFVFPVITPRVSAGKRLGQPHHSGNVGEMSPDIPH